MLAEIYGRYCIEAFYVYLRCILADNQRGFLCCVVFWPIIKEAFCVVLYFGRYCKVALYVYLCCILSSLPKATSLLEREEGQLFSALFKTLRLHGITDSKQSLGHVV